eukprot:scaffold29_cov251-Pinguiococcus_pyrenoidosus.AAC.41
MLSTAGPSAIESTLLVPRLLLKSGGCSLGDTCSTGGTCPLGGTCSFVEICCGSTAWFSGDACIGSGDEIPSASLPFSVKPPTPASTIP